MPYYSISILAQSNFANILMWLIFFYVSKKSKKEVKYSLIVTTIENYAKINKLLHSLAKQKYKILSLYLLINQTH